VDASLGGRLMLRFAQVAQRAAHGLDAGQLAADALVVEGVRQFRRFEVHVDRQAELFGNEHRFRRRVGDQAGANRHAAGVEQGVGFHVRQYAAPLGDQCLGQYPAAVGAAVLNRAAGAGYLQQQLLVLVIGSDVVEQLDDGIRRAEDRDAGFLQCLPGRADLAAAHETAAQRDAVPAGDVHQSFGDGLWRDHGERREHDQDGVDLAVGGDQAGRFEIALAVGIAPQVDRIGATPLARQQRFQGGDRVGLQGAERDAEVAGAVGRHAGRAGAVAEDGQAAAARMEAGGQGAGGMEELAEIAHADDAGPAHGGVEDLVGQFGGVGRQLVVAGMLARFEQDDRLDAGRRAQGADEAPGVADFFDVQQDVAGAFVVGQVVEDIAEVDVHCFAERDGERQADAVGRRPVEHGGTHRAGLGDQGEVAGQGGDVGEGGVQRGVRADDAERFRAEEADAGIERRLADAPLGGCAVGGDGGGMRDDDGVADTGPAALGDDLGDGARCGGDDRQVDRRAGRFDVRHAGLAEQRGVARIDRQ